VGGFSQLPAFLAAGLDIRLGCIVSAVTTSSTSASVAMACNGGPVQTLAARAVLVSVPLGVLKRGSIRFSPPLPTAKQTAINRMGVG
jgi:monoamine oxidase